MSHHDDHATEHYYSSADHYYSSTDNEHYYSSHSSGSHSSHGAHEIFGLVVYPFTSLGKYVAMLVAIIGFVVVLEIAIDSISAVAHDTPFAKLIHSIQKELMIVGITAFVFKIVSTSTKSLSADSVAELEFADTLIPVFSFCSCSIGLFLVHQTVKQTEQWNSALNSKLDELLDSFFKMNSNWKNKLNFFKWHQLVFQLEFRIFHNIFCELYQIEQSAFAFDQYVDFVYEKFIFEVVHAGIINWFLFGAIAMLDYCRLAYTMYFFGCEEDDKQCVHFYSTVLLTIYGLLLCLVTLLFVAFSRLYENRLIRLKGITDVRDYPVFLQYIEQQSNTGQRMKESDVKKAINLAKSKRNNSLLNKQHEHSTARILSLGSRRIAGSFTVLQANDVVSVVDHNDIVRTITTSMKANMDSVRSPQGGLELSHKDSARSWHSQSGGARMGKEYAAPAAVAPEVDLESGLVAGLPESNEVTAFPPLSDLVSEDSGDGGEGDEDENKTIASHLSSALNLGRMLRDSIQSLASKDPSGSPASAGETKRSPIMRIRTEDVLSNARSRLRSIDVSSRSSILRAQQRDVSHGVGSAIDHVRTEFAYLAAYDPPSLNAGGGLRVQIDTVQEELMVEDLDAAEPSSWTETMNDSLKPQPSARVYPQTVQEIPEEPTIDIESGMSQTSPTEKDDVAKPVRREKPKPVHREKFEKPVLNEKALSTATITESSPDSTRARPPKKKSLHIHKIFLFGSPHLYFHCAKLLIVFIALYIAVWLIYISSSPMGADWKFFSILPGIVSVIAYSYVIRSAALLKSVIRVDNDAVLAVVEAAEESKQLMETIRQRLILRLQGLKGADPRRDLLKLFRDIDMDGDNYLSLSELCLYLNALDLYCSHHKFKTIFRELDLLRKNKISFEVFKAFLFPNQQSSPLESEEKRLLSLKMKVSEEVVRYTKRIAPSNRVAPDN